MKNEYAEIALDQIELSTTNDLWREPERLTPAALQDLADNIKKVGVHSPVLVRPGKKKKYQLIFGERRFRASELAGVKTIPARIRDMNDDDALEAQAIENLQRENINPMKEAAAFEWMTKNKKLSAAAIADRIGKSADYVQERIKLTSLSKDAQEFIRTGVLPLKAGLKLARIPEALHKNALSSLIRTIDGATGKQFVFAGMEDLQDWLDRHAFNELAKADFDTEDAKLVPSAGACSPCPMRTKNTGGLFDDIAKNDHCLNAACFKSKQAAIYVNLKEQLTKKHEGVQIVFKGRESHLGREFPKLQPQVDYYNSGREISATEAEKVKDKKNLKLAVLIGTSRWTTGDKKKFVWLTTEKESRSGSAGTTKTPAQKAKEQKERDDSAKRKRTMVYETQLTTEYFLSKTKMLTPELLREIVIQEIDDYNIEPDEILCALKVLDTNWTMEKRSDKKRTKILIKAKEADLAALSLDHDLVLVDERKLIESMPIEKVTSLFAWVQYNKGWEVKKKMISALKIDTKAIASKAKSLTATWWKEEQAKRKTKAAPVKQAKKKK